MTKSQKQGDSDSAGCLRWGQNGERVTRTLRHRQRSLSTCHSQPTQGWTCGHASLVSLAHIFSLIYPLIKSIFLKTQWLVVGALASAGSALWKPLWSFGKGNVLLSPRTKQDVVLHTLFPHRTKVRPFIYSVNTYWKVSPHYQPLIPVSFTVMFLNTKHGLDIDCPTKALCVGALGPQVVDPVTKGWVDQETSGPMSRISCSCAHYWHQIMHIRREILVRNR